MGNGIKIEFAPTIKSQKLKITPENKRESGAATIFLRPDGIMQFEIHPGTELKIADVKEIIDEVFKIGQGKKFKNLIFLPHMADIPYDLRVYVASPDRTVYTRAEAYVIHSMAMMLVGNFYIRFHKPGVPTKLFTTEGKAVEWLNSLQV